MKRVILFILLSIAFAFGVRAQMVNNIPNYLYSGSLGVGRSTANDANVYLQVGPNGAGTKGMIVPWVADTSAITGTKRNFLFIRSSQLGSFAYWDSVNARWYRIGFTDTTTIATRLWAEKVTDDTAAVLRAAISAIPTTTPLSSLTAATGTNTIDNANYTQEWRWNTSTGVGLKLSSTSTAITGTSSILDIRSSGVNSNAGASKIGLYANITNSGTSSTNYGADFIASGAESNYGARGLGSTAGLYGLTSTTSGYGVYGLGTSGSTKGVYGVVTVGNSIGVQGSSIASTGTNYGVYGSASGAATENNGGYFTANAAGTNYALRTGLGNVKIDTLIHSGARFVKHNAIGVLYGSDTLTATGAPISGLTAATGTNTINNADYAQEWQWNTLSGNAVSALKLSSTSTAATASETNSLLSLTRSGANSNSSVTSMGLRSIVSNSGTLSFNYAGYFDASGGSTNYGVRALSSNYGVYASSSGTSGQAYAVYGENGAVSVFGGNGVANGTGIRGDAYATTGTNYGAYAQATGSGATTNYGGYFTASGATTNYGVSATGSQYGVQAIANAASGTNYGINSQATGAASTNYGGYFAGSNATTNVGIRAIGSTWGVQGEASGTGAGVSGSNNADGGKGVQGSSTNTTGTGYGVYGTSTGAKTTGYGGWFSSTSATTNYAIRADAGISSFNGAINLKLVTKTADYTADATDYTILADCTSGNVTITLPAAAGTGVSGRVYIIKRTDNSGNTVTVDGNASETIDGATTYVLSAQYKYVTIQSNGTNWFIIGNN